MSWTEVKSGINHSTSRIDRSIYTSEEDEPFDEECEFAVGVCGAQNAIGIETSVKTARFVILNNKQFGSCKSNKWWNE
jgi:hypothetical protein